jgi:DNA-binding transcriptional regulator YiaG
MDSTRLRERGYNPPMTAAEFKQRRLALALSVQRLALLLGVTPASVHRWESGKAPVPAYAVERLAEIERTRWPRRS